jgi:hypothetical protein
VAFCLNLLEGFNPIGQNRKGQEIVLEEVDISAR